MWMNLESVIQGEANQKEKTNTYINAYMWNQKKMVQMNLFSGQD